MIASTDYPVSFDCARAELIQEAGGSQSKAVAAARRPDNNEAKEKRRRKEKKGEFVIYQQPAASDACRHTVVSFKRFDTVILGSYQWQSKC